MGGDLEGNGRGLSEVLLSGKDRTEMCQTRYWPARTEPQCARRNTVPYGYTQTVPDEIQCVATLCCRLHVSTDYFSVEGWRNRSFHRDGITMLFQLFSLEFCLITLF